MSLKTFLQKIFPFLFKAMQRSWNKLPKDQQDAIVKSGKIGQLIKTNLDIAGSKLITLIALETGLSEVTVGEILINLSKKFGNDTAYADSAAVYLQRKLMQASSDEEWNGLLTIILNAGATLLTGGALQWAQIAIGLGEWAYQKFIKKAV
jgi:hypothetical protein